MEQRADVCIICALEEEADAVEHVIAERWKEAFTTGVTRDSRFVYRSTTITNNKQELLTLVLLCQTRPGPVSAAFDLGRLLQVFQPCFVGMSGICAGDKRHLHLGDLAVAEHAYHFEAGKVTRDEIGTLIHQPEGITYGPTSHVLQHVRRFEAWKTPIAELKKDMSGTDALPHCVMTPMASGMAVRSDDPFEVLQRQHRKTWALDMEAASFYMALRATPYVDGLVVKGVVDYADSCKDDTFHDYAARASAIYLLTFIQEYVTRKENQNTAIAVVRTTRPVITRHPEMKTLLITIITALVIVLFLLGEIFFLSSRQNTHSTTSCSSPFAEGATTASSTTAFSWFQPCGWAASYVIIHYAVDDGTVQNVLMDYNSNQARWESTISGISPGQVLTYSYTYQNKTDQTRGIQHDTGSYKWRYYSI